MKNKVIWFTGLSGSGKTTISEEVLKFIPNAILLDGDVLRDGLCSDLGFSIEDRNENIRRAAETAKLLYEAGKNVIVAFISPINKQRLFARTLIPENDFILINLTTPLKVCEHRDVKGLYKKAREGKIPDFTGINSPFENPSKAELEFNTGNSITPREIARKIVEFSFNDNPNHEAHDTFIGRWCPFHKGHFEIMKQVYDKNKRPLLVLVRDTDFDQYPAEYRRKMVEASMKHMQIPSTVQIIPDIKSVNWGRGVGYETNCIDVDKEIKHISATEIREKMKNGDPSWKEIVCDGVTEFIEENGI